MINNADMVPLTSGRISIRASGCEEDKRRLPAVGEREWKRLWYLKKNLNEVIVSPVVIFLRALQAALLLKLTEKNNLHVLPQLDNQTPYYIFLLCQLVK